MKKLMTALFISAALGMPFLAAAEAKGIDLVQAAHLTVEQKLEGPCIIKGLCPEWSCNMGSDH